MWEIFYAGEFKERYNMLPAVIQKKAEKQEKIFRQNPFHPSLHTEKLEPKSKEVWSFRIDKEYRILFKFVGPNRITFYTCGHHNWIYRYII